MKKWLLRYTFHSVAILIVLIILIVLQSFRYENKSVIGTTISDFSLRNIDGKNLALKDYADAKGFIVIFTCNHCPFAKLYTKRLNELNTKYKALGVPLLAINSMDTLIYEDETFEKMQQRAKSQKFNFPYLYDNMQTVGKEFQADHTPHAYVIWKRNNQWTIEYSGAIDDNGAEPTKVTNAFVANAADELLQRKAVSMNETKSIGCAIFYRK